MFTTIPPQQKKACKPSVIFNEVQPSHHSSPPQKKTGRVSTTPLHPLVSKLPAMLPTTNQQAAALGRDGAARFR